MFARDNGQARRREEMRIYGPTTARPCDAELQSSLCYSWRAACVYKVGAFESEALRVPEHCQFDHIDDTWRVTLSRRPRARCLTLTTPGE